MTNQPIWTCHHRVFYHWRIVLSKYPHRLIICPLRWTCCAWTPLCNSIFICFLVWGLLFAFSPAKSILWISTCYWTLSPILTVSCPWSCPYKWYRFRRMCPGRWLCCFAPSLSSSRRFSGLCDRSLLYSKMYLGFSFRLKRHKTPSCQAGSTRLYH